MNRLLLLLMIVVSCLLPGCSQRALPEAAPSPVAAPPREEPSLRTVQALIDEEKEKLERLRGETAFLEEALSAKKRALDEREKDQATPPASSTEKPLRVVVEPGAWRATGLILQPGLAYVIRTPYETRPELYAACRFGTEVRGHPDPLPAGEIAGDLAPGHVLWTRRFQGELLLRTVGDAVEVEIEPGVPRESLAGTIDYTRPSRALLATVE